MNNMSSETIIRLQEELARKNSQITDQAERISELELTNRLLEDDSLELKQILAKIIYELEMEHKDDD